MAKKYEISLDPCRIIIIKRILVEKNKVVFLRPYFTIKYFGAWLERSKKRQEQKHRLELYERVGKMTNEGINLEEAMKKSLSITEAIEKDFKKEQKLQEEIKSSKK